ncbi:MAG: hypothetical protein H6704_29680 [Myxococcales bacterium]|nr:hypothetical protein [Myxococcales bacterium]MCB9540408.1 hypothetical protein [Myxococcales bacterium]
MDLLIHLVMVLGLLTFLAGCASDADFQPRTLGPSGAAATEAPIVQPTQADLTAVDRQLDVAIAELRRVPIDAPGAAEMWLRVDALATRLARYQAGASTLEADDPLARGVSALLYDVAELRDEHPE